MLRQIKSLFSSKSGVTSLEYGVLAAILVVGLAAAAPGSEDGAGNHVHQRRKHPLICKQGRRMTPPLFDMPEAAMPTLHTVVFVGFATLLIAAAYSDLRRFEIPNAISIALVLLYPVFLLTGSGITHPVIAVAIAVAAFLIGGGLFAAGWLGGGDVKLFAAVALWVSPAGFPDFLVGTALFGGVLALILMTKHGATLAGRFQIAPPVAAMSALKRPMPYGVAIAVAGIVTALQPILIEVANHAKS